MPPASPGSGPRPGHQVVEDEEDEDERRGHSEEQPAVVAAGARHAGEALHAARQQPCHAQKIRVLAGKDTLEALQDHRTSQAAGTHKDEPVQLQALHRTPQQSRC